MNYKYTAICALSLAITLSRCCYADDEAANRNSQQPRPWNAIEDRHALDSGFRSAAGWFILRANLAGPSHGVFRVSAEQGPFIDSGLVYKQLTFEGYGRITSDAGTYDGWAFETNYDGKNGPKYLFFSNPGYYLLSFRNGSWKFVAPCTKEEILRSTD